MSIPDDVDHYPDAPGIYGAPTSVAKAINEVMKKVTYVQKVGKNEFHNYKYASDGDILAQVQPAMAEAGLLILQNEAKRDVIANGAVMSITYNFTLAHISGEVWPVLYARTGLSTCLNSKGGFDDKAANKCSTAARKYFVLSLFWIPTGLDEDPDNHETEKTGATKDKGPPAQFGKKALLADKLLTPEQRAKIDGWCAAIEGMIDPLTVLEWENEHKDDLARLAKLNTVQWNRVTQIITDKTADPFTGERQPNG